MNAPRPAALLWSGGKDSALALYRVQNHHPELRITQLVTCVSQAYDRVSMHGVRRELITEQAARIGLPVEFVVIPSSDHASCPVTSSTPGTTFPPNDEYSSTMLTAFGQLKARGIEVIVFGDIFLEDLRAYRDQLLGFAGLEGYYPLWSRNTVELFDEFVALGFQSTTVCINTTCLSRDHLGRTLDLAFRESLPEGVDPCGERGEYHTFAFDGPLFSTPIPIAFGEIHQHDPFAFQELYLSNQSGVESRTLQRVAG